MKKILLIGLTTIIVSGVIMIFVELTIDHTLKAHSCYSTSSFAFNTAITTGLAQKADSIRRRVYNDCIK